MGIKLSRATCGRLLTLNRELYHFQVPRKPLAFVDLLRQVQDWDKAAKRE